MFQTWNPKSKTDPYAHSAVELVKLTKETVDDFLKIPISISDYLVQDLADRIEQLFREYTNFAASCGKHISLQLILFLSVCLYPFLIFLCYIYLKD